MKKIASFTIDHDVLTPGMYLSRTDRDVVTYDLRLKKPNRGDYLANGAMHTMEHLFATFARNSEHGDEIVYFGPMGCRTGFYLLVRDSLSHEKALRLTQEALAFIASFEEEIPGSAPVECGNAAEHDLQGARQDAAEFADVLRDWTVENMEYPS